MIALAMPRLLLCVVAALALPARRLCRRGQRAPHRARVVAFYYPWYGTAGARRRLPALVAGRPRRRRTTSRRRTTRRAGSTRRATSSCSRQQMDEIRGAGIDEIAVSWWGQGSAEDQRLPAVIAAARADGIAVAAHLEPYARPHGRRARSPTSPTCGRSGSRRSTSTGRSICRSPTGRPRRPRCMPGGVTLLRADRRWSGAAAAAGFDGVYTYDIVTYGGDKFASALQRGARAASALRAVGRARATTRGAASGDPRVKPRRNGATYDAMWRAAIARGADRVTITSFNEWHEGTQIEPAAPRAPPRRVPLPLVRRRVGPARRRRRDRLPRADALLGRRLPQDARRVQPKTKAS